MLQYLIKRSFVLPLYKCCNIKKFSTKNRLKVLFLGTDNFSVGILNALNQMKLTGGISELDVISSASSRIVKNKTILPPVLMYAEKNNLQSHCWVEARKNRRLSSKYDVAVVASFGDFIPAPIISQFEKSINVHPSLLPRWRGAAPVIHTIFNNDRTTGVSIIEVSKHKFDVGNILYQIETKVPDGCTSDELLVLLMNKAASIMPYVMSHLDELFIKSKPQDESLATLAPKVSNLDGFINLQLLTCEVVSRIQRALPEKIGISVQNNGKRLKLGKIVEIEKDSFNVLNGYIDCLNTSDFPNGYCHYHKKKKTLFIKLKDGWIGVKNLHVECKKEISATDFYNGYMINTDGTVGETIFKSIEAT
ncbi:methionyl-tRNA formyltransferase, mitochondrial isoform X1 [Hydra vulgaris]|uniref:methionyl-tRNA formyltransferase, mitochondrial isoform X1 n=1 Tax=Hydra vulgaris TaxID=6087 RepID=UPI001F5F55F2|nr:methionyl-tRNA formyltransferase, mitochondrial [Hydra vulgaris]